MDVAELPTVKSKPAPFFTKENAKLFAAQGHEAKRQAGAARVAELARLQALATVPADVYVQTSLSRTRGLIEKLEEKLEKSTEPQAINYLTAGLAKLRDIEQKLANRPLPGSRRPGRESTSKAPSTFEPSE